MESTKIFSTGSSVTLLPETSGNLFHPLTFAKYFERQALWNAFEQKTPSYLNTALKVLLTIPLLLIQKIAMAMQGLRNAGLSLGNCLFSKRTIVVVTPPTIDDLPTKDKPFLDDSKKDVSKTEVLEPSNKADNKSLLHAAAMGDLEGVKNALDNAKINIDYQQSFVDGKGFGATALILAARDGHKEIVELLLNAKANPNIVDSSRINADCELDWSSNWSTNPLSKYGETALMKAARNGHNEIVELLLNAGADPNILDLYGDTALIFATEHRNTEIVSALLNKRANPNIISNPTALMAAAQQGHNEIVELLLNAKADPNIQSGGGNTALILATNPDTIRLLLKAGADPDIQNKKGVGVIINAAYNGWTDIVKELIDANANVNIRNKYGMTPLMWAVERDHKEVAELLINAGADLNIINQSGNTALLSAAYLGRNDIVKLLIDAKANLNVQNKDGLTALMFAAEKHHKEVVKLLLDAGADSDVKDNQGKTVLSRLRFVPNPEDIVELINNTPMSRN